MKKAGFPANYSTENYSFTLAKAYHGRSNGGFLLFGDESSVTEIQKSTDDEFFEGARVTLQVERIERDFKARQKCIDHFGPICQACYFNFESAYGEIGKEFIHVHHHRTQLACSAGEHAVDPILDLIPVCPNCHAMIHRPKIMLTVAELREHMAAAAKQQISESTGHSLPSNM